MSSKGRGTVRVEHDAYLTPLESVYRMLAQFKQESFDKVWLEPARGDGRIHRLMPAGSEYAEIREGKDYFHYHFDADIGMTNPPFSLAEKMAVKMLRECYTVVLLQRLNWLGSQSRRQFWQRNPVTHLFVLADRPAFVKVCKGSKTQKGCGNSYPIEYEGVCECGCRVAPATDSVEYVWFVWDRGYDMIQPPGVYVL